eukprot:gb/GEZJ01002120.1/.p1 GENE.gb/GEZJ01002120.1/~~gb/GEZJ01002120.1/.p1  ORF type:complete len:488 (-),score=48.44 gb/GEZJ01002120.1/:4192-5655(-)
MLELPFGNGVTAAIIFLLFELVVFPVLLDATAKVAYFFIYARAKRGNQIQVEALKFPFWSEGLFHRNRSHLFLLVLRIVCIAFPVYLETRLISREVPTHVSTGFRNAFVVSPQDDWDQYQDRFEVPILILRENSERVFDECVQSDGDNWVSGRVANVTYAPNKYIQSLECVDGTAKRVFRQVDELPPFVHSSDTVGYASRHENNITVLISWIEGPLAAFAPSPGRSLREGVVDDDDVRMMFEVQNITVTNLKGIECFTSRSLQSSFTDDGIVMSLMCQNVTGRNVDYYMSAESAVINAINNETRGINANATTTTMVTGRVDASLFFVGRLQFENEILLNAGHFPNVDFITVLPFGVQDFRSVLRRVLYTRADNITVSVPGEKVAIRTILDEKFITIAAAEIVLVLLFGMTVQFLWRKRYRHHARPNTVDGLSKCWANCSEQCLMAGQADDKRINLRLLSSGWEITAHCLDRTAVGGEDIHDNTRQES